MTGSRWARSMYWRIGDAWEVVKDVLGWIWPLILIALIVATVMSDHCNNNPETEPTPPAIEEQTP